jgi:hypothetical protein
MNDWDVADGVSEADDEFFLILSAVKNSALVDDGPEVLVFERYPAVRRSFVLKDPDLLRLISKFLLESGPRS